MAAGTETVRQERAVLTSWKEIARYLGKGVRTLQRWECRFGLPVRRPNEKLRGYVTALPDELDRWLATQWSQRRGNLEFAPSSNGGEVAALHAGIESYQQSRSKNRQLLCELSRPLEHLRESCAMLAATRARSRELQAELLAQQEPELSDDERTMRDKQIAQLRQELASTKEYLQSIIEALESTNEELQSANEEIQSGNEELQSTNEELQTSKEELESANEELHTVNEEMQHRNDLLTQLYNDLNNLLNSIDVPMVMVGPDLGIRRFTPQAGRVLGLTATDVGRPITRLKLKTDLDNLEQRMLDVMSAVRPKQYSIRDGNGQPCAVRLTPYRTADNRIDGVVLSVLTFEGIEGGDGARRPASRKSTTAARNAKGDNKGNGRASKIAKKAGKRS